jgi:hypothetical protein
MSKKIIIFDLECKVDMYPGRGLFGGQKIDGKNAYLLAFNYKVLDVGDVKGISIHETKAFKKDFQDDYDVVKFAYDILTDDDVVGWVTFYGSEFDIPLLNTRLQFHGLPILPQTPHDDLYKVFKSSKGKLALSSYGLDYICEFYGLPRKTKVPDRDWVLAKAGNKEALQKISTYGKNDVAITEKLFHKAKALNGSKLIHYFDGEKEPCMCKVCGSYHMNSRGILPLANGLSYRNRYQCADCGKWDKGSVRRYADD